MNDIKARGTIGLRVGVDLKCILTLRVSLCNNDDLYSSIEIPKKIILV